MHQYTITNRQRRSVHSSSPPYTPCISQLTYLLFRFGRLREIQSHDTYLILGIVTHKTLLYSYTFGQYLPYALTHREFRYILTPRRILDL